MRFKMRLKLKKSFLSLSLLFIGLTLFSCAEEPLIDPVKETFTTIRVVNLSTNISSMTIRIDETQPVGSLNNLAVASPTEYFDVKPGRRNFQVFDENNNLIFTKIIELSSWERNTVAFSGFYSPEELENTFTNFEVYEGLVYVNGAPAAGTANAYFVNGSTDYGDIAGRSYVVGSVHDGTVRNYGDISFTEIAGVDSLSPSEYMFYFVSEEQGDSTAQNMTLNGDLIYYFFLHGRPDSIQVFINEVVPPPARSRG
jgi:hypothetical protein